MKLYSYTVVSDNGYAPNPTGGVCTLAYCMSTMRRTVQAGDYVVGLAGSEYRKRVGAEWPGYPVIYAMRVTDVIGFEEFRLNARYRRHIFSDSNARSQISKTNRVLIGDDFIYWGSDGPLLPSNLAGLIKRRGPGHKCNFPSEVVQAFIRWFESQPHRGLVGTPFEGWVTHHAWHRPHSRR